jgi:hypothetical protein
MRAICRPISAFGTPFKSDAAGRGARALDGKFYNVNASGELTGLGWPLVAAGKPAEANYTSRRYPRPVMRGLDPRIHRKNLSFLKTMDCWVKPGNDARESTSTTVGIKTHAARHGSLGQWQASCSVWALDWLARELYWLAIELCYSGWLT